MEKVKLKAVIFALALAAGVAQAKAAGHAEGPSEGTAKVFIYRYKQFAGAALEPSVFCDESQIARMDNGRYFVMTVALGKHVFRSNDMQSGLELEAVAGKEYYLRVELVPGAWKFHGHLVVVAPEQGAYEVKRLQLLDPGKVKDRSRVLINGTSQDAPRESRASSGLTNDDVVAMAKAGLGDELIVARIREFPSAFALGTEDLVALKKANVSDQVISEMMKAAKKNQ